MATTTPNIGLTLPDGTENITRSIINGNNTLIDTAVGSLSDQITTLNRKIYAGRKQVTIAANAQTEVEITLPVNFSGGSDYIAIANVNYYGTAKDLSGVLIRNQLATSFWCRIYNAGTNNLDAQINWIVVRVA